MAADERLPEGAAHVRTTPTFTGETVPAGLLATHRVAAGNWAVLAVHAGTVHFTFDDRPSVRTLRAGESQVIPPQRPHHIVVDDRTSFDIAFYRYPPSPVDEDTAADGR